MSTIKAKTLALLLSTPDWLWNKPLEVGITGFENKALAQFYVNLTVGCAHGCLFCYVAELAAKLRSLLEEHGIYDPRMQWGDYMFPRAFDENVFRTSLRAAIRAPGNKLRPDGPRAVMFCTTCDPFQASRHADLKTRKAQNRQMELLFVRAMEMIRDESDLKVRILTRSPLARKYFDLMKSFGDRLLFGMSIPTLNDEIAKKYEPHAPGVQKRLETLQLAKEAGLNVYVAAAPTFPEQDWADYERLLLAIRPLEPVTVFHEPINRRGSNVRVMVKSMADRGMDFPEEVFKQDAAWANYAMSSFIDFENVAHDLGLGDALKLGPDKALMNDDCLQSVVDNRHFFNTYDAANWIQMWWDVPSAWPGEDSSEG